MWEVVSQGKAVQNGGLESVLRGMGQSNVDVGVFQEKKLTDDI